MRLFVVSGTNASELTSISTSVASMTLVYAWTSAFHAVGGCLALLNSILLFWFTLKRGTVAGESLSSKDATPLPDGSLKS